MLALRGSRGFLGRQMPVLDSTLASTDDQAGAKRAPSPSEDFLAVSAPPYHLLPDRHAADLPRDPSSSSLRQATIPSLRLHLT